MSEPLVQLCDLVKHFGAGEGLVRAVDGVSLDVAAGELVLIMGPSGSGKTTLLTMIGGLLRPTSGSIVVNGQEITAMSAAALTRVRRHLVGFIFQSFNLWESLSVIENVELALNIAGLVGDEARQRARRLLEERGLGHRLGFRCRDLSGGEKQRLSIARALANDPLVLLADEPPTSTRATAARSCACCATSPSRASAPPSSSATTSASARWRTASSGWRTAASRTWASWCATRSAA